MGTRDRTLLDKQPICYEKLHQLQRGNILKPVKTTRLNIRKQKYWTLNGALVLCVFGTIAIHSGMQLHLDNGNCLTKWYWDDIKPHAWHTKHTDSTQVFKMRIAFSSKYRFVKMVWLLVLVDENQPEPYVV